MGTDMPPSRYRVVERGRRLIVVDSETGAPITGLHTEDQARIDALRERHAVPPAAGRRESPPPPPALGPARPTSQPGSLGDVRVLETQPWFDDKAPRRVRIGEQASTNAGIAAVVLLFLIVALFVMFDWPGLVVAAVLFLNLRKAIRKGITGWLDAMEPA